MSSRQVALTAFRGLLRTCRDLEKSLLGSKSVGLCFRLPLAGSPERPFQQYNNALKYREESMKVLFPNAFEDIKEEYPQFTFLAGDLAKLIRRRFRGYTFAQQQDIEHEIDEAFDALRILSEQKLLAERTSITETSGVQIEATSRYVMKNPLNDLHYWAYRCQIRNLRQETINVFARRWIILDSQKKVAAEVPYGSRGLIGQSPSIPPGGMFEYYSQTMLEDVQGSMQGSFQLLKLDNEDRPIPGVIDAQILPFQLLSSKANAPECSGEGL